VVGVKIMTEQKETKKRRKVTEGHINTRFLRAVEEAWREDCTPYVPCLRLENLLPPSNEPKPKLGRIPCREALKIVRGEKCIFRMSIYAHLVKLYGKQYNETGRVEEDS
jgi:hypothetical protein